MADKWVPVGVISEHEDVSGRRDESLIVLVVVEWNEKQDSYRCRTIETLWNIEM